MTEIAAAHTLLQDTERAAEDLARQINASLSGPADAIIVFASARFDYETLLRTLDAACTPGLLIGSSSAGEFTHAAQGSGTASALALKSDTLEFSAGLGQEVARDSRAAARQLLDGFNGMGGTRHAYRAALVMTDALAGHAEEFVDEMTLRTSGRYLLAGGGAGDDANFTRTHVFHGTQAFTDAAVALEILSDKPIGVGVGHGWLASTIGVAIFAEFRAFANQGTSPVTRWLRALAALAHRECGGPGVGAIGMCFTGNFALTPWRRR